VPSSSLEALRNLVYLLFLGLESARHAITGLVEFEPEKVERTIVVLISELEAYRFLCGQFTDEQDVRHQRPILRASDYREPAMRSIDNKRDKPAFVIRAGCHRLFHSDLDFLGNAGQNCCYAFGGRPEAFLSNRNATAASETP